ncbi:MAG: phosphate--acyl-ACP acyltransferase, partial [Chloroflexia bacterium]|nr:phosphate--acyl-ACP acyltransferase [Chloroflexia bacterium]
MPTIPVIAVDAMGGDHGPEVVVSGAVSGARRFGASLLLHGDEYS